MTADAMQLQARNGRPCVPSRARREPSDEVACLQPCRREIVQYQGIRSKRF